MVALQIIYQGFADDVAFVNLKKVGGGQLFHHPAEGAGGEEEAVAGPYFDVVTVAFERVDVGKLHPAVLAIYFDEEVVFPCFYPFPCTCVLA